MFHYVDIIMIMYVFHYLCSYVDLFFDYALCMFFIILICSYNMFYIIFVFINYVFS